VISRTRHFRVDWVKWAGLIVQLKLCVSLYELITYLTPESDMFSQKDISEMNVQGPAKSEFKFPALDRPNICHNRRNVRLLFHFYCASPSMELRFRFRSIWRRGPKSDNGRKSQQGINAQVSLKSRSRFCAYWP